MDKTRRNNIMDKTRRNNIMDKNSINILFIGDIVANFGRRITREVLPSLKDELKIDIAIANAENSAGGNGITEKVYDELVDMGIDAFTSGNHIWDKKEFEKKPGHFENLVRPANYPPGTPGKEYLIIDHNGIKVAIFNLLGRVFINPAVDCPFRAADRILEKLKPQTNIVLVDVHAEATSEKTALFWYLNGRVSAMIGTHTHIQTADDGISTEGTAAITDVGMVAAMNSIIGMKKENIINRFLSQMPHNYEPEDKGPGIFNSIFLKIDASSGKALEIKRVNKKLK